MGQLLPRKTSKVLHVSGSDDGIRRNRSVSWRDNITQMIHTIGRRVGRKGVVWYGAGSPSKLRIGLRWRKAKANRRTETCRREIRRDSIKQTRQESRLRYRKACTAKSGIVPRQSQPKMIVEVAPASPQHGLRSDSP